MKRTHIHYILGVMVLLLLVSCGQQYKAKQIVKDYIKEHATEEIDIISFSNLDSTKVISDSLIQAMQENAKRDPLFKEVTLPVLSNGEVSVNPEDKPYKTLLYIRMHYREDSLDLSRTFYFDHDLTRIIAFK